MNAKTEPQIETVTMDDARIVEFAGKRKMLKSSVITAEGKVQVRIDWRNGETRLFTLPDALLLKFAAHGAEQKLGDETAGLKDDKGQDLSIDDLVLVVDNLIERLNAGTWNVKREANGLAGTSILIRALVEMYDGKRTVEQIKAFLKDKSQAEKNALRANAKVKPIVERLEAEKLAKAGSKVNTDKLLDELDGVAEGDADEAAAETVAE